ncbi:MAG: flagellin [Dehalococcoidia bacterium]|nr:flagellin [Dehalococcoidia bacterium]
MGMQITTNVAALNAQRNVNMTGMKMGKVLEKLSSGYRINRAADDAAGLGISEKMRAQIKGNQQAVRNAQDGISMLQTAEGALDEVHSILQRMRELSVQAANGTYAEGSAERTSIGQEINQLKQEIDRIADSTTFNGQNLLTGSLATSLDGTSQVDVGVAYDATVVSDVDVSGAKADTTFTLSHDAAADELTLDDGAGNSQTISLAGTLNGETTLSFGSLGVNITLAGNGAAADDVGAAMDGQTVVTTGGSGAAQLQVGANNGDSLSLTFGNMKTSQLGDGSDLATEITDDQNVSTIAKAETLITELDGAIEDVNAQRGEFGAAQNRLESTVRSLSVAVENLSAAESRIRDADIAKLSSELVSNQILQQAGVSVLSQANAAPQAAVSLLQ